MDTTAGGRMTDWQVTDVHSARDKKPRQQSTQSTQDFPYLCTLSGCEAYPLIFIHSSNFLTCFSIFFLRGHYAKS